MMKRIHFKDSEFACKCGCGGLPTEELMNTAEIIRSVFGRPMVITSGFRCAEHNKKIGGSPKSQHMLGLAMDVKVPDANYARELIYACNSGIRGIGIYDGFIHLDIRDGTPVLWKG